MTRRGRRLGWALGITAALLAAGGLGVGSQETGTPPAIESLSFPRVIPPDGSAVRGELRFSDPDLDAAALELTPVRAFDFPAQRFELSQTQTDSAVMFALSSARVQPIALSARVVDAQGNRSAPVTFHFAAAGPEQEVAPDVYFINAWGEKGDGPGQFDFEGPHDLKVGPDGRVYVIDQGNHRVQVFEPDGTYVTEWGRFGTQGPGRFNFPTDLAFAPDGNVYVSDSINDRIQVFDPAFNFLFQWGGEGSTPGRFLSTRSIEITRAGEVFVADERNGRIQVFDLSGNFLRQWGELGEAPGEFNVLVGIDVDEARGEIYAADGFNHRIQVFDLNGNLLRLWGEFGTGEAQFNDPVDVAVAPEGWVGVTDSFNHRVQLWSRDGRFLRGWGQQGDVPGDFRLPLGAETDGLGMFYVGDHFNRAVQAFYVALEGEDAPQAP